MLLDADILEILRSSFLESTLCFSLPRSKEEGQTKLLKQAKEEYRNRVISFKHVYIRALLPNFLLGCQKKGGNWKLL